MIHRITHLFWCLLKPVATDKFETRFLRNNRKNRSEVFEKNRLNKIFE